MFGGTFLGIQMFFVFSFGFLIRECFSMVDGSQVTQSNILKAPKVKFNETHEKQTVIEYEVGSSPSSSSGISVEYLTLKTTDLPTVKPPVLKTKEDTCGLLTSENVAMLTQEQFINKLTEPCRYDKLIKPKNEGPLDVYFQVDLRHIEAIDSLQFKAHMVMQYSYRDSRLDFEDIAKDREIIMGQEILRDKIWVPHVIVRNEKDTMLMGSDGKDIFVTITPSGNVTYSYRMTLTFYCWMNLQKFPFDVQICTIVWNSWAYNTTNLLLHWHEDSPIKIASNLHLTEFVLVGNWTEVGQVPVTFAQAGRMGNYSSLVFKFQLSRQVGYYILDYFLPSILLVCMSWVSFWLQADASPPRATLGTSTMLAFITLNGGLTKNLPKVSYIKASEVWFLGCVVFIFGSMAEFAFVNVIWRRKKKVELKKQNSKHILKGALTPSLARKQLRKAESENSLFKSFSTTSLDTTNRNISKNYLTVHGFPNTNMHVVQTSDEKLDDSVTSIPIPDEFVNPQKVSQWKTMTPQEVAMWIDRKSRIAFPLSFLVFNLFYWTFVYAF